MWQRNQKADMAAGRRCRTKRISNRGLFKTGRQELKHERMATIEARTKGFSKTHLQVQIVSLEIERDAADVLRRWILREDELLREMATRTDGG